jgi:hypothetical protein
MRCNNRAAATIRPDIPFLFQQLIGFGYGHHIDAALFRQGTNRRQLFSRRQLALCNADHDLVSQLHI